jgi:VWFA-related protein
MMFFGPQTQQASQQQIPDAPKPQLGLPALNSVRPGDGATPDSTGASKPADAEDNVPSKLPSAQTQTPQKPEPEPEIPATGQGPKAFTLHVQTNFVEVPFTVKDKKGKLVPGIKPREIRVYENNLRQQPALFTVDPWPLSVALVIDQSMTYDNMTKVNNALSALQGAFAPYDEVAVFTYNNGPRLRTDFTGSQSARLTFTLEQSKGTGREPIMPLGGPLAQTTVINDKQFDPATAPVRNHQGMALTLPKEVHTLNDAIFAAATQLTKTAQGRRRVIYVISDGKEYGSQAKYKDVVKYLQTNKIAVYGTLVGDSSLPVIGFLDRIHLPLTMRDNILPLYAAETGGNFDGEFRQKGIEESFARIAEEVRTQYTLGYYSHEPFIDGKYRQIEVKVMRPDLTVIAKKGYYPTASDTLPANVTRQPTQ